MLLLGISIFFVMRYAKKVIKKKGSTFLSLQEQKDMIETYANVDEKTKNVKLNGKHVRKSILSVDSVFLNSIYDELVSDNTFLTTLAKVSDKSTDQVKEDLKKDLDELADENAQIIMYSTIIKNEFLKLEVIASGDKLEIIAESSNTYEYTYTEAGKVKYSGYFKNNSGLFTFNVEVPDSDISVLLNVATSTFDSVTAIDTSDAVSYETLSEDEKNALMGKIMQSKGYSALMEDIASNSSLEETEEESSVVATS